MILLSRKQTSLFTTCVVNTNSFLDGGERNPTWTFPLMLCIPCQKMGILNLGRKKSNECCTSAVCSCFWMNYIFNLSLPKVCRGHGCLLCFEKNSEFVTDFHLMVISLLLLIWWPRHSFITELRASHCQVYCVTSVHSSVAAE